MQKYYERTIYGRLVQIKLNNIEKLEIKQIDKNYFWHTNLLPQSRYRI